MLNGSIFNMIEPSKPLIDSVKGSGQPRSQAGSSRLSVGSADRGHYKRKPI